MANFNHITKGDIVELKSMANPPQQIKDIWHAVLIIFDDPVLENGHKDHYYKAAKKCMANSNCLSKFQNYQQDTMTDTKREMLLSFIKAKDLEDPDVTAKKGAAAKGLHEWVLAVVKAGPSSVK